MTDNFDFEELRDIWAAMDATRPEPPSVFEPSEASTRQPPASSLGVEMCCDGGTAADHRHDSADGLCCTDGKEADASMAKASPKPALSPSPPSKPMPGITDKTGGMASPAGKPGQPQGQPVDPKRLPELPPEEQIDDMELEPLKTHVTMDYCLTQLDRIMRDHSEIQDDPDWYTTHIQAAQMWLQTAQALMDRELESQKAKMEVQLKRQQMRHEELTHQQMMSQKDEQHQQQLKHNDNMNQHKMKVADQVAQTDIKSKTQQSQIDAKYKDSDSKAQMQHQTALRKQELSHRDAAHKLKLQDLQKRNADRQKTLSQSTRPTPPKKTNESEEDPTE